MVRHGGRLRPGVLLTSVTLGCLLLAGAGGAASAQSAAYFSPTYAASEGSPYSEVYARTFGAGGPPLETSAPPPADPPRLAAPPAPAVQGAAAMVYVIEGGRLLTYNAEAYANGGEALVRSALPSEGGGAMNPEVRVPTVTDQFYAAPALETAAGRTGEGAPIPLLPQKKPAN
jgi:hypothetical protein